MDKKQRASLDGINRRDNATNINKGARAYDSNLKPKRSFHASESSSRDISQFPQKSSLRSGFDIHQSLNQIDDEPAAPTMSRRKTRKLKSKKNPSKRRRIIKWIIVILLLAVLAAAGWLAYKFLSNTGKVFDGGVLGLVQKQKLKQDANGRSNFVIFGTEEDSENGEHGGANLTDSIMVLSVNQEKNDAYMLSIPRDLWIEFGTYCYGSNEGKINEVYSCYSQEGKDEDKGAAALQREVGEVLGLDIQYHIHVNFSAMIGAVDAVGGVDVTIESNPKGVGILDRNFDWRCGYKCYYVKYEDGQQVHLDGEHALALARARGAAGGYGLADSNFDREKNQQKILKALRQKALSVGTLTNLSKVTALMDTLGDNLRTNIETKEIQTIMTIASELNDDSIISLSLNNKQDPLVTTGMIGASSAVYPVAGIFNYSQIHNFVKKETTSDPVVKENAKITVLNGSGKTGVGQRQADNLADKGFNVVAVDNAPEGNYAAVEIYQLGDGNSATKQALQKIYTGAQFKDSKPPIAVQEGVSFVIIFGKDPTDY